MDVLWCLPAALCGAGAGWWWCRRIWRRRWAVERDGRARTAFAAQVQLRDAALLEQLRADAIAVAVATSVVDQALKGRTSWELES